MKNRTTLFITVAFVWLLSTALVTWFTGSVIVDGFQSVGAAAGSRDGVYWPMMGDFMGFNHQWGFHWPGQPLIREWGLGLLSWTSFGDLSLLAGIHSLSSLLVCFWLKKRGCSLIFQFSGMLLALFGGPVLVALTSYRPEFWTGFVLLLLVGFLDKKSLIHCVGTVVALLLLPLLHPMGVAIPIGLLAYLWLIDYLVPLDTSHNRGRRLLRSLRKWRVEWIAYLSGVVLLIGWFTFQHEALGHFLRNIESQRVLKEGLSGGHLGFFVNGMKSRLSWFFVGFLMLSILAPLVLCYQKGWKEVIKFQKPVLCSLTVLGGLTFNVILANPNPLHLIALLPVASFALVCNVQMLVIQPSKKLNLYGMAVLSAVICLPSLGMFAKRSWMIYRFGGVGYRPELVSVLRDLPDSKRVLIPVCFWEAGVQLGEIRYRFSTYPNITLREIRGRYEQQVLDGLEDGDLILWDPLQDEEGIYNFVEETSMRAVLIRPPEQPSQWAFIKNIKLPVSYSSGQSREFALYRYQSSGNR